MEFEKKYSHDSIEIQNQASNRIIIDGGIEIHALNTAIGSSIKEAPGKLFFPESCYPNPNKNLLKIAISHHPLSWLNTENSKSLRNHLQSKFDIIINGHEHQNDLFKVSRNSNNTIIVESSAFEDPHVCDNGFVVLDIDNENKLKLTSYKWTGTSFEQNSEPDLFDISIKNEDEFTHTENFRSFINDIGAGFNHRDRENLSLHDVYLYPNISIRDGVKVSAKRQSAKTLFDNDTTKNILLIGEETIGKTSLLKSLHKDLKDKSYIPIYVNGSKIGNPSKLHPENLDKIIGEQYENTSLEKIIRSGRKTAFLLDNLDQIKSSATDINTCISNLVRTFDYIIITASDSFEFTGSRFKPIDALNEFEVADILRFGHKLRNDLIDRWNSLKHDCSICPESHIRENDKYNKIVNGILRKNIIPPTPIFILATIQSIDSGTTPDAQSSSFGYYYQYLITTALGAASIKKDELDEYFSYLSELSNYLFSEKTLEITEERLLKFGVKFCDEYGLPSNISVNIEKLISSKILIKQNDTFNFKYPYIYYFFLSKYISDNLENTHIQEVVVNLVNRLDIRKNSEILTFLIHHSKSPFVLNLIINKSNGLLKEFNTPKLNEDTDSIYNIISTAPSLEYKNNLGTPREFRSSLAQKKDNIEESQQELCDQDVEDSYTDDDDDVIFNIICSIKSLELLSQIVKNHYGSLKKDMKKRIITEAMNTPLKVIEVIISGVKENPEKLIDLVKKNIKENIDHSQISSLSPNELEIIVRESIFNFMVAITFGITDKIASSLSHPSILQLIDEICSENNSKALTLISYASKLDIGKQVSPSQIKDITSEMRNNNLCLTLARAFILKYLYMFEVKDSRVQEICSAAGINYTAVVKQISLDKSSQ